MIGLLKKLLSICQSLSKGNPTRTSGNSMNLLEAPNKDLGAASPTLQNPRPNYVCDAGFCELYLILLAFRGTQREYSSKPLKHSIVKRILVFKW